jgi:hypothetical protein
MKYYLFEKILNKIKFNNFKIVFDIFNQSINTTDYTIYCNNKDIYDNLKILNIKGKTILDISNNSNIISEL